MPKKKQIGDIPKGVFGTVAMTSIKNWSRDCLEYGLAYYLEMDIQRGVKLHSQDCGILSMGIKDGGTIGILFRYRLQNPHLRILDLRSYNMVSLSRLYQEVMLAIDVTGDYQFVQDEMKEPLRRLPCCCVCKTSTV
jgi:hypothetical protein